MKVIYDNLSMFVSRTEKAPKCASALPKMARLVRGGKNLMYAVIETGGKQYRVQSGDVISVEKLPVSAGDKVTLDRVLVFSDGKTTKVGTPYVENAKVETTVVENGKGDKVIIFKYKAKKDYRKKQGHRQPYTMLKVESLEEK
jgi:large subunit ribosomal protein L21